MTDHEPPRLFRGNELPRLIGLVAITLVGWAIVWNFAGQAAVPQEPPRRAEAPPDPIVRDRDPAFESVQDKAPLGFRDTAAYDRLLRHARDTTPDALAASARRDVHLAQLFERPGHYRGVPIHILGTALRVLRYESKLSRTGWLYEAWVTTFDDVTRDSQLYPYVCVFEELPPGFPVGPTTSERVTFNGYFLKLMAYRAGDTSRVAPLLVGRLGWSPSAAKVGQRPPLRYWFAGLVAILFVVSCYRWLSGLKRSLTPRTSFDAFRTRPTEEIAPEDLSRWVDTVSDRPEPEGPEHDGKV